MLIFSIILSSFSDLIQSQAADKGQVEEHQHRIKSLDSWFKRYRLSGDLRERTRRYFDSLYALKVDPYNDANFLMELPSRLKTEVAAAMLSHSFAQLEW